MKPQSNLMEMATRVLEFLEAHPFSDRNRASIATRFAKQVAEAKVLVRAEHEQRLVTAAGSRQRQDLRRHLEVHLVRSVMRVGKIALRGDEQVASRFAPPVTDRRDAAFVTRAATLLEAARTHQDALVSSGLKRAQLNELAAGLQQFERVLAQVHTNRRQHRETRAALERASANLAELLQLLDVCNRDRFRDDAPMLSLWTNLRTVKRKVTRRRGGEAVDAAEVPVAPPPAPPPAEPAAPAEPAPPSGTSDDELPPGDDGLSHAA